MNRHRLFPIIGIFAAAFFQSLEIFAAEPIHPALPPLPAIRATTPVTQQSDPKYNWLARHQQVLELFKTNKPEIVMIGDSITHVWGGEPVSGHAARGPEGWKRAFGGRNVANLGFGSDRTENVLWCIDHGELDGIAPKHVVLLIGINNIGAGDSVADTVDGIDAVCRRIHEKLPDTHLVLLGLLPCQIAAYTDKAGQVNRLLQTRLHPRPYVDVFDAGNKFRNADGTVNGSLFGDSVHPNAAGYVQLGTALSAFMDEKIQK